jgi:uncharacterized protein (DUF1800 family)
MSTFAVTEIAHDGWQPYVPSVKQPWNLSRVVHLHRRAGFAATWTEIQRDLRDGPDASVSRILNGTSRADGLRQDFDVIATSLATAAEAASQGSRLPAWWVFRMLFSPDPLGERLTLMWHNHFATSNLKIENLVLMRRQNEIFREYARAPFGDLLRRVVKDPAMLEWLDASANRKEHPNENLAREIMELFTLGVGNYTESDVKQGARALTGWTHKYDRFCEIPQYYDDGEKTILGQTGNWRGDDFVDLLLARPATTRRLAFRLCELFMGEEVASPGQLESLASALRENRLTIGCGVERILRSDAFFDESNIRSRVSDPTQYVIGAARVLEQFDPPLNTVLMAEWIGRMGLELFNPPNVFGWRGGRTWINSRSVVARTNYACELVEGALLHSSKNSVDVLELIERHSGKSDTESGIRFLCQLILGAEPSPELERELQSTADRSPKLDATAARRIAISLLSSPEAQIC